MQFVKSWVIPCLVGALVCTLILWAFEGFERQDTSYFVGAFLKSLGIMAVVIFLLRSKQKKQPVQ